MKFPRKIYVTSVNIYETLNAGAVVRISAKSPNDQWMEIFWTPHALHIKRARKFSPRIKVSLFEILFLYHVKTIGIVCWFQSCLSIWYGYMYVYLVYNMPIIHTYILMVFPCQRISFCSLIISIQRVNFPFNELRIEIDCSVSNSWVEIDAVEIVGGTCTICRNNKLF